MKKSLPLTTVILLVGFTIIASCSHKYYTASDFEDQTLDHKTVAILPAEMIFTGTPPKNLTAEDIAKIEEAESLNFQQSLYNNILQHANSNKYWTKVNFQDITTTQQLLEQNKISPRDSWKMTSKELAAQLGVDAVVRMKIRKQRYMSDLASYGISVGKEILAGTSFGGKILLPAVKTKTNDIITSCDLVSDGHTLWNDSYTGTSDWNTPSADVIENITDNYGRHFPYKKKR